MIFNQDLDSTHLSGGWIIMAKKNHSHRLQHMCAKHFAEKIDQTKVLDYLIQVSKMFCILLHAARFIKIPLTL